MGNFTDAQINAGIDSRVGATPHLSAHTAFSTTGTNEVTGGSPAYARQVLAMDSATGRLADNTDAETLDIPSGTTVRWLGVFSAITAGTFRFMVPNGATQADVGIAENSDNTIHIAAHGWTLDQTLVFLNIAGALPTGITEGQVYHVIGTPNADDFQISATQGGGALSISTSGPFVCSDIIEETFGSQGTIELAAGDFDVIGIA